MLVTIEFLEKWSFTEILPEEVRTNNTIEKYEKFKKLLKENNILIEDYIINKYLKDKKFAIEKNSFPYNTPRDTSHYVLWINPLYFKQINDKQIIEIILTKMKELGYNEYFCFENHIGCKSVLKVPHFQVFFRKC